MKPRARSHRARGFTLLELLLAAVITSIIVGGAVSVLQATRLAERRLSEQELERARHDAIVDWLAERLENIVRLGDGPMLRLRPVPNGGQELHFIAATNQAGRASHEALLVRWGAGAGDIGADQVVCFTLPMSGSVVLLDEEPREDLAEWCQRREPIRIGDGVRSLRVDVRTAEADGAWASSFDAEAMRLLVRVRSGVGGAAFERILLVEPSRLPDANSGGRAGAP